MTFAIMSSSRQTLDRKANLDRVSRVRFIKLNKCHKLRSHGRGQRVEKGSSPFSSLPSPPLLKRDISYHCINLSLTSLLYCVTKLEFSRIVYQQLYVRPERGEREGLLLTAGESTSSMTLGAWSRPYGRPGDNWDAP